MRGFKPSRIKALKDQTFVLLLKLVKYRKAQFNFENRLSSYGTVQLLNESVRFQATKRHKIS